MATATGCQFSQENDLVASLFVGDMVVAYAGELFFQLVDLVVVGSEERLWSCGAIMQVFDNAPCQ